MDPPSDWMSQGTMMLTLLGASWTTGTLRSPIHMVTLPSQALSGGVPLMTESDRPDPLSVRVSPGITGPYKRSRYGVCPVSSIEEPSDPHRTSIFSTGLRYGVCPMSSIEEPSSTLIF